MLSGEDDFITKAIKNEISNRKNKKIINDFITSKNSKDNGYTKLLNKLANEIKKKKRKKTKMVQLDYRNPSTLTEDNKAVVNCAIASKKSKEKNRQASNNLKDDILKNDVLISKVNSKATVNSVKTFSNSEDHLQYNSYLLSKKKKKKKKKKSHMVQVTYENTSTLAKDDVVKYNVKTDNSIASKKSKKKKRQLSCDTINNDLKADNGIVSLPSKVPVNTTLTNDEDNMKLIYLSNKMLKKKRKKTENMQFNDVNSTTLSIDSEIKNNTAATSVVPHGSKKVKKKNITSSIVRNCDFKRDDVIISKANKANINTLKSVEDNMKSVCLFKKKKKKKRKKNENMQADDGNSTILSSDIGIISNATAIYVDIVKPKKAKKKTLTSSEERNYNFKNDDVIISKINKDNLNTLKSFEANMGSTCLFKTQSKKNKKDKKDKNTKNQIPLVMEYKPKPKQQRIARENHSENIDTTFSADKSGRGTEIYEYGKCGMFFTRPRARDDHKSKVDATHEGNKDFVCEVCGNTFEHKSKLSQHFRTHTSERPYACDVCAQSFSYSSTLVEHNRTHIGEKPYACDVCGKSFSCSSTLVKHYRTHTGEKPYACDVCGKSFAQSTNLKIHYRTHTGEKPYACDACGKSFTHHSTFVTHCRTHTGEKPYECGLCEKSFTSSGNRNDHTFRKHVKSL